MNQKLNMFNWIAAIVISFFYSLLPMSLVFFLMTMEVYPEIIPLKNWWIIFVFGIFLFFIFLLLWYLLNLFLVKLKLDKNNIFRFVLILIAFIPLIFLSQSSPPVKNNYSWKDVKTPENNTEESYNAFKKFATINIDCSFTNIPTKELKTNVLAHADIIEKCWENSTELHDLVKELNSYNEIADLTVEIKDCHNGTIAPLAYSAKLVYYFSKLKIEQNDFVAATDAILPFNFIIQKSYPYSRTLIQRLVFLSVEKMNLTTIEFLVTNKNSSVEIVQKLKNSYKDIDSNFKSCMISEYLIFKPYLEKGGFIIFDKPAFLKQLAKIASPFIIDKNRCLRDAKKFTDTFLACLTNKPPKLAAYKKQISDYRKKPQLASPISWFLTYFGTDIIPIIYNITIEMQDKRKELVEKLNKM